MTRNAKFVLAGFSLGLVVITCNLTANAVTSQAGQTLSNVAWAQALSEQAQANQQLARAVQSVTHTMNLLLIVVVLLAFLGAGLYIWKTKNTFLSQTASAHPNAHSLPSSEAPLQVVYLPRPPLPPRASEAETQELLELQAAELWHALTSGKEWQA